MPLRCSAPWFPHGVRKGSRRGGPCGDRWAGRRVVRVARGYPAPEPMEGGVRVGTSVGACATTTRSQMATRRDSATGEEPRSGGVPKTRGGIVTPRGQGSLAPRRSTRPYAWPGRLRHMRSAPEPMERGTVSAERPVGRWGVGHLQEGSSLGLRRVSPPCS